MRVTQGDSWSLGKPYRGRTHRRRASIVATVTTFLVVAGTLSALADNTISDGDGLTPVADSNMTFGTICVGVATSQTALVAINRNGSAGSTNVFKDGSTVTVSVAGTTGTGLTASMDATQVTLPANWGALANNSKSSAVSSTVTLTPASTGSFSGTITYRGSGVNSDPSPITRDDQMNVSATVVSCDSTPPAISKTVTGTLGNNGWYTSNVQVQWTATDAQSAVVVDSGCGTQNFTTETAAATSSCSAHSAGGSASDSVNLKIDKTGPTANLAVTGGTLGSHGWHTSNVTVSTSGVDALSDSVVCTADQHLVNDSTGTSFTGSCTNGAGLSTSASPLQVKLDKTAPTISFVLDPAANANGWNKQSSVAVKYTCLDATSGLDPNYGTDGAGCWPDDTATIEGLTSFTNRAVYDMAGNSSSVSADVWIDRTPPDVEQGSTTGTLGLNGWYTSDVSVDFTASDGLSGLDHPLADGSFTLTTSGEGASVSTDSRTVSDKAGNDTTAGPLTFNIDKAGPHVSCSDPSSGWSATDISVDCTASDTVSGLEILGDASFSLSTSVAAGTETDSASIGSYDVCDTAGSCTTVGPWNDLKVDKKAPGLSCGSADGAWHGDDVSIGCTAADGGSGLNHSADASFDLTTNVVAGAEDANASTGSHQVCDAVGNCDTAGPISGNQVDKKAPDVSCGSADGQWHATDVQIGCIASDGGSGLGDAGDASFDLTTSVSAGTEDANASTDSRSVCDAVNNCATAGPVAGNQIDKKGPSVSCDSPDAVWHDADVTANCTITDGGSGAAVPSVSLSTSVAPGTETSSAFTGNQTVYDNVGNAATAGPVGPYMVDKKAPGLSCGSSDGLWHAANVTITCSATDLGSGLNVSADSSFGLSTSVVSGTEDGNASTDSHQVCDAVNNCATAGPIGGNQVDLKAPDVSCASADGLWHAVDATIACSASDGGSGLDVSADANFNLTTSVAAGTETSNASTGSHQVCDAVNNCVTAGSVSGNEVDKKGPSITIATPAEGASVLLNQAISSSFSCTDGGSGSASCTGLPRSPRIRSVPRRSPWTRPTTLGTRPRLPRTTRSCSPRAASASVRPATRCFSRSTPTDRAPSRRGARCR